MRCARKDNYTETNLHIRPYAPSDWARIQAIHDAARRIELSLAALSDAFLPLSVAAEREGLFDYTVRVAVRQDVVVGFVAYSDDELAWLYVDPAAMRQGVGSRLVRDVLERTTVRLLHLEVLKGNAPACALYGAMGFHVTETAYGHMPGNEAFPVCVLCMQHD